MTETQKEQGHEPNPPTLMELAETSNIDRYLEPETWETFPSRIRVERLRQKIEQEEAEQQEKKIKVHTIPPSLPIFDVGLYHYLERVRKS